MKKKSKVNIPELHAGAGRGAEKMFPSIAHFNRTSDRFRILPTVVDPAPGKAQALARRGQEIGLPVQYVEAKLEDEIDTALQERWPVVMQIDRPSSLAVSMKRMVGQASPVMAYLLIRTPYETLFGLRVVIQANEDELKELASRFFEKLSGITVRSGADQIFGDEGQPEHLAAEPLIRDWFGRHVKVNLPKITGGVEPESSSFELTRNGVETMQMFILENPNGWADPFEMATDLVDNHLTAPLVPGKDFMAVELGPDGVRFHTARIRKTDRRLAVRDTVGLDPASIQEAIELERHRRAMEEALRRAERQTLSRRWPIWTTD